MMNFRIKIALQNMRDAVEFVDNYKKEGNVLFLLSAGAKDREAFRYIFEAKKFIPEEEWKIWDEIYWDFYQDLNYYVLN